MKAIGIGILALAASFSADAYNTPEDGIADPGYGCIAKLPGDWRLGLIADKVTLGYNRNATAVEGLPRQASVKERAVIALWLEMRQKCFNAGEFYRFSVLSPHEHLAEQNAFEFQQRVLVKLQQGQMTYIEFNRRRAELAERLDSHI